MRSKRPHNGNLDGSIRYNDGGNTRNSGKKSAPTPQKASRGLRAQVPLACVIFAVMLGGEAWLMLSQRAIGDSRWVGTDGSWTTASNWNPASVPTASVGALTFSSATTSYTRYAVSCETSVSGITTVTLKDRPWTVTSSTGSGTWYFNNGGSIVASSPGSPSYVTLDIVATGALSASMSGGNNLNLGTSTTTLDLTTTNSVLTLTGAIYVNGKVTGAGSIVKTGTGITYLNNSNNDYTGSTTVSGGTLYALAANSLPSTTDVTIQSGATLDTVGTQSVDSLSAAAGGTCTVASNGTLAITGSNDTSFAGYMYSVNSKGTFIQNGTGTFTVTGTGYMSGIGLTVNSGTVAFDSISSSSLASLSGTGGTVQINGAGLTVSGTSSSTYAGTLTSATTNTLTKNGAGTLTLSGNVSNVALAVNGGKLILTGGTSYAASTETTIGSGSTLQIGDGTTSGTFTSTSVLDNGNLTFAPATATTATYSGTIHGAGTFTQNGPGRTILSGTNTYSGGTTVSAGTLQYGSDSALGTGTITLSGGTLDLAGHSAANALSVTSASTLIARTIVASILSGNVAISSNLTADVRTVDLAGNGLTLSGNINGGGTLTMTGTGVLTVNGTISDVAVVANAGILAFTGTNSHTITSLSGSSGGRVHVTDSPLTISGTDSTTYSGLFTSSSTGTLIKDGVGTQTLAGSVSNLAAVVNGGTLAFSGTNAQSLIGLSGSGGAVEINGKSLVVDNATDSTYSGTMTSSTTGTLIKNGSGTQTLGGAISNLAISIGDGTLVVTGTASKTITALNGVGALEINDATLSIGSGSYSGDVTSASTGTLAKDGSGTLTLSGAVSNLAATVNSGMLIFTGTNAQTLTGLSGTGGTVNINGGSLTVSSTNDNTYSGMLTSSTTGTLIKNGSGMQTLGGSIGNLAAVVNGGTLAFTGTDSQVLNSLTGAGSVAINGSTLTVSSIGNSAFSGTLTGSGTGTLAKDGSGRFTVDGAVSNIKASVYNGTLAFTGTADKTVTEIYGFNTGTVDINGTTLTVSGTGGNTYSGTLTSTTTGTLVKNGSGTQNLGGAISNVAVVVNGGFLSFFGSDSQTLLSLAGTGGIVGIDSANLTVSGADSTTYSGMIMGSTTGTLVKDGSGTLTLGGNVTGLAAVVNSGTLAFTGAAGKALTSLTGAGAVEINGANLAISTTDNFTYSGTMTSTTSGILTKYGSGEFTLGGSVSNIAAIVNGGTLAFTGSNAQTLTGLFGSGSTVDINGGTLTINSVFDSAYSGILTSSSTGALTKTGAGTFTLGGTADNVDVNVNAGTFVYDAAMSVGGTATNTATVNTGGTLTGIGTLYNLVNYGTVSPGNSGNTYGTLNVAGNFTNSSSSSTNIHINNSSLCSKLAVTGTATLGGVLNVTAASGSYNDKMTYTFLTAGTVEGTYSSVTDNLAFFNAYVIYDGISATIGLELVRNYVDVANTDNQRSLGAYLDRQKTGATGDFQTVLEEINGLSDAAARSAYDTMSGEMHASLFTVGMENTENFLTGIANRVRSQSMSRGMTLASRDAHWDGSLLLVSRHQSWLREAATGWTSWAQGFGVAGKLAGNGNTSGLGYSTGGLALGLEKWLDEDLLVGFAGGYSNTYTLLDDRSDHSTVDGGIFAAYLQREFENRYFTGVVSYGYNAYDTSRQITIGNINRTAEGSYGGNGLSLYTEIGQNIRGRFVHLQPFAGLEYIWLEQNAFTETGADSMNISTDRAEANSFRGMLGTRVLSYFRTDAGQLLTLEGRASWRHEFLSESHVFDATFAGQTGTPFAIQGADVDRDAAIFGTGLSYELTRSLKLRADYDLLLSKNYTAHAGTGGVEFAW